LSRDGGECDVPHEGRRAARRLDLPAEAGRREGLGRRDRQSGAGSARRRSARGVKMQKEIDVFDPQRYEILILGSGPAGKLLAWTMASSGRRTALIERRWIGGACPNIACLPSKNEIWSAKVAHLVRHALQIGTVAPEVTINMVAVRRHKRDMVEREVAFH